MPQDVPGIDLQLPLDADTPERAAVEKVIALHPMQLTLDELVRELTEPSRV
jgi:hypothetical protein